MNVYIQNRLLLGVIVSHYRNILELQQLVRNSLRRGKKLLFDPLGVLRNSKTYENEKYVAKT